MPLLPVSEIICKGRFRKDMGDLCALQKSIETLGLLQPIVVTDDMHLIAGGRRLAVFKKLNRSKIPAVIVDNFSDAVLRVQAEADENTCRKEMSLQERTLLAAKLERLEAAKAKKRKTEGVKKGAAVTNAKKNKASLGGKLPPSEKPKAKKTRDTVAEAVGMSGRTYTKAKKVVESGDKSLIDEMNKTGKASGAFNKLKQKEKVVEIEKKAKEAEESLSGEQGYFDLVHGDVIDILERWDGDYARLIFADPPYNIGIDYGEGKNADQLPRDTYLEWCKNWIRLCWENLTDDGSFWLLVSDEYAAELCCIAKDTGFHLRSWIKWFEGFGVNCSNKFNRTTRHIFYFVADPKVFVFHPHEVMQLSDRQTKYQDRRAASGGKLLNDLWDIPRLTGTCKERIPSFPTQIPLAITDRIVRCASDPGDLVIDPFNGSGTTGLAAVRNRRRYMGIDKSEEFIELSKKRLLVGCRQS